MAFSRVSFDDLAHYKIEGNPIDKAPMEILRSAAASCGLPPDVLEHDEQVLRLLVAVLLAAGGAERPGEFADARKDMRSGFMSWCDVRDEAQNFLVASIKRDGALSAQAADTVNLLNKPQAVEGYKNFGNRWTVEQEMGSGNRKAYRRAVSGEIKSQLLDVAEKSSEPSKPPRAWYRSKMVLWVLLAAAFFVIIHIALLIRVLTKVHNTDNSILMLPMVGLTASALVAVFAIGVNKLSGS